MRNRIAYSKIKKIIRETIEDDLKIDRDLDLPVGMAPGRGRRKDQNKKLQLDPGSRFGATDTDTFNIVRPGDEMHIFDFDDTLGEGFGPTLVAAAVMQDGVLKPITNFVDVLNGLNIDALTPEEAENLEGFKHPAQQNTMQIIRGRWFKSDGAVGLNGADVVTLDTAAFADFRSKFSKVSQNQNLPIPIQTGGVGRRDPNNEIDMVVGSKGFTTMDGIPKAIAGMNGKPDGSVLIAYDFSPSMTLGDNIERYPATNNLALASQAEGEPIGVITARKGVSEFDSFSGQRPVAQNAKNMKDFLKAGGLNWNPNTNDGGLKFVHGAADYSNSGGAQKAKLARSQWLKRPQKHLRFYDDDKGNALEMSSLCDDPDVLEKKRGGSINIYSRPHGGFKDSIGEPVYSCMIEGKRVNLSERMFRKIIREAIVRSTRR